MIKFDATISYDSEADAMYFKLLEGGAKVTETEQIDAGVFLDYSEDDLFGIEVLDASCMDGLTWLNIMSVIEELGDIE